MHFHIGQQICSCQSQAIWPLNHPTDLYKDKLKDFDTPGSLSGETVLSSSVKSATSLKQ